MVDSALGCSVALSSPVLSRLPSYDTHTSDTLIPTFSTLVDEGSQSRDGFPSGPERVEELTKSPELADGCARLRTKTKLATKSTVKLELANSQKLPEGLDEFGNIEISEFPVFRRI